jgi:hypothetical protein
MNNAGGNSGSNTHPQSSASADHAGSSTTGANSTNAKRSASAGSAHRGSEHAARWSRSGQTDNSQNGAINHLNDESLQAAQQGHPFDVGSSGNTMGGMSGHSQRSGMGSGMGSGSGSSGSGSSGGASSGGSHM